MRRWQRRGAELREEAQGPLFHPGATGERQIGRVKNLNLWLMSREDELRRWDVVRVAPQVVRAFGAGPQGLELIAIGGPKPEGSDGEMLEVAWPE